MNFIKKSIIGSRLTPLLFSLLFIFFTACSGTLFESIINPSDEITFDINVLSITTDASADTTYKIGDNINISLNLSEPVTLSGGNLQLTLDSGEIVTITAFGPGSIATGTYTVAAGNSSSKLQATKLEHSGGTLRDNTGKDVTIGLSSTIPIGTNVAIDGIIPDVSSISFTPNPVQTNNKYDASDDVDITVTFTEPISLSAGSIDVTLDTGDVIVILPGDISGDGLSATKTYTVSSDDNLPGGLGVTSIAVNGGTVNDSAGNTTTTLAVPAGTTNAGIIIDGILTSVAGFAITTDDCAAGQCKQGNIIDFEITFSETITLTPGETLNVTLETGEVVLIPAASISGANPSVATGQYTVGSGVTGNQPITMTSVTLSGGVLTDGAGNVTAGSELLANSGAVLPLDDSNGTAITIDSVNPTVTSVTVPGDGSYKTGTDLDFVVNFSENITVTNSDSTLALTIGVSSINATQLSTGASSITYRYTVQAGDIDTDGIAIGVVTLNTTTVQDAATNNADMTLNNTGSTANVFVDGVLPTVTSVTVPGDNTYTAGMNLDFTVNFSENVTVTNSDSTLALTIGVTPVNASQLSTTSSSISYRYTVQAGENDSDGITVGTVTLNTTTVQDSATNNADMTLNGVGSTAAVLVNASAPAVTGVTVPGDGSYKAGTNLDFVVNFSENITVTGADSTLGLTIGATPVNATQLSTAASSITYRYIVLAGQNDTDGIAVGGITLNTTIVKDGANIDSAIMTLNNIGSTANVLVDTTDPTITSVNVPADATYIAGNDLDFTVNFDEIVTVTGTDSTLAITIGASGKTASYQSKTTTSITYRYTVLAGDNDTNGITVGAVTLNTTTVQDTATNNANMTLNGVGSTASVLVDTTAPVVTSVTVPADSTYIAGNDLDFTVNFNDNVTVTGTDSTLAITIGASGKTASYQSKTATSITYRYAVLAGDNDSDGIAVGTITLNTTTVQDAVTNNANMTLNGVGSTVNVLVDTIAPNLAITSPTAGSYVNSSQTVTFTGSEGSTEASANGTDWSSVTSGFTINSLTNWAAVGETGFTLSLRETDSAGNTGTDSTSLTKDTVDPVISSVSPAPSASVNSTLVSYTMSENCSSASITWARTGGAADSDHVQSLTGSELNSGAHSNITLTNNPTLVDTSIYTISYDCADLAGNTAVTVSSTNVTYTDSPLSIVTADTMDTDNNGKIDTYRVSFNKSVNDSTFPGYSINAPGSVTSEWLVAGFINVRLLHGSSVSFATDTVDDATIYVRFDETLTTCSAATQVGCDTGAKPDLTTTASPGLEDLATNIISQVGSIDVTEADGAQPVVIAAISLGATSLDVIFSEAVEQVTAETSTNYTVTSGVTVSGASRDGSNFKKVHLTTSTQTGGTSYTLTVNTNVKDLANFNLNPSANTAVFDGLVKPVVSSIVTVNTNSLTITFNELVTAASTECTNLTACALIYENASLPVLSAVSTLGSGVNSALYTLTVNDMIEGQNYTTTVLENTVTSVASSEKMGNVNNSATFIGDGRPGVNISTDTATDCPGFGADRVVIQYDQAVTAGTVTNTANYTISLCITGDCGTGSGNPNDAGADLVTDLGANKFAVDFTDTFDTDPSQYRLTIQNVQDVNGNNVASPTNLSFQCGNDTTAPIVVKADVISSDASASQIMITFSESVDQVTANTAGNYKYDSNAYGTDVNSAARQSNTALVLVTYAPGLDAGGHQVKVQNVQDLAGTPNTIIDDGVNNVQPVIINAPSSLGDGEVFQDPFNDGTKAAYIVKYDGKLYLGADANSAKIFETDYGLTTSQTITMDADGTAGSPIEDFYDYVSTNSGTIKGVDAIYAACIGGTSTPDMTGVDCTGTSGTEKLFIGALNIAGNYISFWETGDKSSSTTTFTFTEGLNPDPGGGFAYRSTVFLVFKDYLWNHFGAEAGGGGRGGRICVNPAGCSDGNGYLVGIQQQPQSFVRIGNAPGGTDLQNGSEQSVTGDKYLNAVNVIYEYDNDDTGPNESQLYMANGGIYDGTLGSARATYSDGGILRTNLTYSTKSSLPANCTAWTGDCDTYWEDLTPDSNTRWNNYVSIPYPENSAVTGSANCGTGSIEMDCSEPYNIFTPAMKAIPYMRTAPNGDLYMLRNACSSQQVCVNGGTDITGFGGCEFRTEKQVCPSGSEVPQLWMLPKNCGTASQCASAWTLVSEGGNATLTGTVEIYTANGNVTGTGTAFTTELAIGDIVSINGQTRRVDSIADNTNMVMVGNGNADLSGLTPATSSGMTNMSGNTVDCGISPNKCLSNTHATLLEFVGDYLYVGFDNASYGAMIWRTDMSAVTTGNMPAENTFSMVNIPGLDGTATNQKIFSHITVNDSGTDWLILTTRDGSSAVQIYRTANGQN